MQGAVGPDVARLWQALGLPPHLEFTPELADDVEGFQSGHGLVADGVVGPMTVTMLLENTVGAAERAAAAVPAAEYRARPVPV